MIGGGDAPAGFNAAWHDPLSLEAEFLDLTLLRPSRSPELRSALLKQYVFQWLRSREKMLFGHVRNAARNLQESANPGGR